MAGVHLYGCCVDPFRRAKLQWYGLAPPAGVALRSGKDPCSGRNCSTTMTQRFRRLSVGRDGVSGDASGDHGGSVRWNTGKAASCAHEG